LFKFTSSTDSQKATGGEEEEKERGEEEEDPFRRMDERETSPPSATRTAWGMGEEEPVYEKEQVSTDSEDEDDDANNREEGVEGENEGKERMRNFNDNIPIDVKKESDTPVGENKRVWEGGETNVVPCRV
jgi:hypothetical protein